MTESGSITVILASPADDKLRSATFDDLAEVIEVGREPKSARGRGRYQQADVSVTRRLNVGISLARSEWVVPCFGDELFESGWLKSMGGFLHDSDACVVLFYAANAAALPLVAIRRSAFCYGPLDERFPVERGSVLHWCVAIFGFLDSRMAPCESIQRRTVDWMGGNVPEIQRPLTLLIETAGLLRAAERLELLNQVSRSRKVLDRDVAVMHRELSAGLEETDPYHGSQAYSPRAFWESNTQDYLRWEVFNPDEPEINDIVALTRPTSVLELGCGAGRNIGFFDRAGTYTGLDIALNLLQRAGTRRQPNTTGFVCGDAVSLCFRDDAFEMVFADSTIQHVTVDRIKDCIAELARVSSRYVFLIEHTDELEADGHWFEQVHVFRHDYADLLARHGTLVAEGDCSMLVQPARKRYYLLDKTRS